MLKCPKNNKGQSAKRPNLKCLTEIKKAEYNVWPRPDTSNRGLKGLFNDIRPKIGLVVRKVFHFS